MKLILTYLMQLRKSPINIILTLLIGLIIGFLVAKIPQMPPVDIKTEVSVFDAISLIVTILLAIYVAKILERDVQNSQMGKQMYLDRVAKIDEILTNINSYIQEETIILTKVNNLIHRYRSIQTSLHKALQNRAQGNLFNEDCQAIESETAELKRLLTDTPIDSTDESNVTVRNGKVKYSDKRINEITACIVRIDNMLFDFKHKINSNL